MMFDRLAVSFLAIVLGLFASVAALAQAPAKEAPKDVRSMLFKQVMVDYPDVRECVTNEEGGTRAAEENMSAYEVDLNRDGTPEYEVGISAHVTVAWSTARSISIARALPVTSRSWKAHLVLVSNY